MPPIVVSFIILLAYLAAGTVVGGALLFVGAKLGKAPQPTPGKVALGALKACILGGSFYRLLLRFLDNPNQPVINTGFYAGVFAAVAISYIVIMKEFEVEQNRIPIIWAPFALGLSGLLFVTRTQGIAFNESQGYYRGYESVWLHNLPEPPDAMATPEKAVQYYMLQYKKLHAGNEDEGIGKILTTVSHWDAKWFNDNYDYITGEAGQHDLTGITKVVTSPNAHRVLALIMLAKPFYGSTETTKEFGNDAVVRMSSGQLVWLTREGKNWKIREWAGMRPEMMKQIYEFKSKKGVLASEDEDEHASKYQKYAEKMKQLCAQANIPYQEFDPYFGEEDAKSGGSTLAKSRKKSDGETSGFSKLDEAKPGEIVDLSAEKKNANPEEHEAEPKPAANQAPPAAGPAGQQVAAGSEATPSIAQRLVQTNSNLDAAAAQMQGGAPTAAPTPVDPNAPTPTPAPTPVILEGVPVETLWPQYFSAVAKIWAGDSRGLREFENVVSDDDKAWFRANYGLLAELITPGVKYTSPEAAQLVVLQTLLRNMPRSPQAKVTVAKKGGVALASLTESGPTGNVTYTTVLVQEGGRWVLAHNFFTRDFVWVPQLALYKQARKMPLGLEEQVFLHSGFTQFQQQVQQIYQSVGASLPK